MGKALYFEGIASAGGKLLEAAISFKINQEILTVEHKVGDGGGTIDIPAGTKISGNVTFKELTAEIFAQITGGTITTGMHARVRVGEETQTIVTNTITLTQAGDVIEDTIRLLGANGTVFKRVSSSPSTGEYSYASATGVCTFNASETESTIYPSYVYADSTKGNTVSFGKSLPDDMEFYGTLRSKNIDDVIGGYDSLGDALIYLKKIVRTGTLEIGGESGGSTSDFSFDFTAIVANNTDVQMSFPVS